MSWPVTTVNDHPTAHRKTVVCTCRWLFLALDVSIAVLLIWALILELYAAGHVIHNLLLSGASNAKEIIDCLARTISSHIVHLVNSEVLKFAVIEVWWSTSSVLEDPSGYLYRFTELRDIRGDCPLPLYTITPHQLLKMVRNSPRSFSPPPVEIGINLPSCLQGKHTEEKDSSEGWNLALHANSKCWWRRPMTF